jgi:hypothetical protein
MSTEGPTKGRMAGRCSEGLLDGLRRGLCYGHNRRCKNHLSEVDIKLNINR